MGNEHQEKESKRRSVDSLQRLYSIVISLSIASILVAFSENILASNISTSDIIKNFSILIAFIVTVVPFYHGANRYLDATYVTKERAAKRYSLLVDFFALFFEAMLFFTLTRFTNSGDLFFLIFMILLLFDVIWTLVTKYTTKNSNSNSDRYFKWAAINLVCISLIISLFFTNWIQDVSGNQGVLIEAKSFSYILTTLIIIGRTVADYILTWDFYYPNDDQQIEIVSGFYKGSDTNPEVVKLQKERKKGRKESVFNRKKSDSNKKTERVSEIEENSKN